MAKIFNWIKDKVAQAADPDRDRRRAMQSSGITYDLTTYRLNFRLAESLARYQVDSSEEVAVCEQVFGEVLGRQWQDFQLTDPERQTQQWLAKALEIKPARAQELNWQVGFAHFETFLARAMDDGVISPDDSAFLGRIAAGMGTFVAKLVREYFARQGEQFLRGVFLSLSSDGEINPHEWSQLLATTSALGLSKQELLTAIQPQAQQFVEHVLADAKSDELLSQEEEQTLNWLLDQFQLSASVRRYVEGEIADLRVLTLISQGKLPSLPPPPGMEIRSGEIVHYCAAATFRTMRQLKNGPVVESHCGQVTMADSRLLFSSPTKSFVLLFRNVVSALPMQSGFEIRSASKAGAGQYSFRDRGRIAFAVMSTAVRRANQTIVEKVEGQPQRHISREVRQRVWQRYGGRCAECSDTQYLEFDHIIPFSKGGSNSDANVQLLCRRCNLKKSDNL